MTSNPGTATPGRRVLGLVRRAVIRNRWTRSRCADSCDSTCALSAVGGFSKIRRQVVAFEWAGLFEVLAGRAQSRKAGVYVAGGARAKQMKVDMMTPRPRPTLQERSRPRSEPSTTRASIQEGKFPQVCFICSTTAPHLWKHDKRTTHRGWTVHRPTPRILPYVPAGQPRSSKSCRMRCSFNGQQCALHRVQIGPTEEATDSLLAHRNSIHSLKRKTRIAAMQNLPMQPEIRRNNENSHGPQHAICPFYELSRTLSSQYSWPHAYFAVVGGVVV